MAIQVRRGNEADFDASKMLPGEWAVSLDTQYVRMCFAPGIVLRMATYEGFENEKAQIQSILAECQSIQSAVERIQAEVNAKASLTIEYSNSAKESADKAYEEAERAKTYASNAEAVTGVNIATQDKAGLVKGGDIYIDEDGALVLITETEDTTLENSNAGRLLFTEIDGAMEQGENPSSTNPQEIRNVAISGIRTHGKNFANFQNAQNSDRGAFAYTKETAEKIVATKNASGGKFVARYVANLKAGTTYNFSLTENAYQVYVYYDKLYGTAYKTFSNTNNATFTPTQDGVYVIGIFIASSVTSGSEITVSNFMLREVGTDATYEPYTESSITFSQPIELYGKDDVRDILTSKQIGRKYAKVVFDGSDDEAWNGSSTVGRYYMNNWGCKGYGFLMCSQAKGVQNGDEELNTCYIHAASNGRFIINTEIPTMTEWKAHLASNPMTVVYELAEETTEELPIADQIALNSLQTFDGITYVEFISDIQPTFKGEYGTSKVGGMTLESLLTARSNDLRLSAVESAVVNNI